MCASRWRQRLTKPLAESVRQSGARRKEIWRNLVAAGRAAWQAAEPVAVPVNKPVAPIRHFAPASGDAHSCAAHQTPAPEKLLSLDDVKFNEGPDLALMHSRPDVGEKAFTDPHQRDARARHLSTTIPSPTQSNRQVYRRKLVIEDQDEKQGFCCGCRRGACASSMATMVDTDKDARPRRNRLMKYPVW
jgi:hypothetical protein